MKVKVKKWRRSVVSDPQRPHGLQPSRLLRPWDFPGKSTGVGCCCLLVCIFSWLKYKPQPLFFWSICQGPRTGVPNLRDQTHDNLRWSWRNNRNKVHRKCNALQSSQNYPLHPGLWKNFLPWNCSLVPKRLGMVALKHLSKSLWWVGEGEGTRHNGESKGCWGGKLWMKKLKQRENGCLKSLGWFID